MKIVDNLDEMSNLVDNLHEMSNPAHREKLKKYKQFVVCWIRQESGKG